ncbi:hypothetical protein [Teichococcus aestuarii]
MSGTTQPAGSRRDWLLSDTPSSRAQARWGRRYQLWLAFRRNPLAVAGLAVVLAMLVLAIAAPCSPPTTPARRARPTACSRPPPNTGWARTSWGATPGLGCSMAGASRSAWWWPSSSWWRRSASWWAASPAMRAGCWTRC